MTALFSTLASARDSRARSPTVGAVSGAVAMVTSTRRSRARAQMSSTVSASTATRSRGAMRYSCDSALASLTKFSAMPRDARA
ncbi:hypothetical protein D3C71_1392370 [compost metagenome]